MGTFKLACPHCGTTIEADEDWVGQVGECPSCGKDVTIQKPGLKVAKPVSVPSSDEQPPTPQDRPVAGAGGSVSDEDEMDFYFPCPHCGKELPGKDAWVGLELPCPACNKTVAVPGAEEGGDVDAADTLDTSQRPSQPVLPVADAVAVNPGKRKVVFAGAGAALLLAVVIGVSLYMRGGWERKNREIIVSLASDTKALYRTGEYEKGEDKYRSLSTVIGDRELRDEALRQLVRDTETEALVSAVKQASAVGAVQGVTVLEEAIGAHPKAPNIDLARKTLAALKPLAAKMRRELYVTIDIPKYLIKGVEMSIVPVNDDTRKEVDRLVGLATKIVDLKKQQAAIEQKRQAASKYRRFSEAVGLAGDNLHLATEATAKSITLNIYWGVLQRQSQYKFASGSDRLVFRASDVDAGAYFLVVIAAEEKGGTLLMWANQMNKGGDPGMVTLKESKAVRL